jgi:dUTP pyrophosphatase
MALDSNLFVLNSPGTVDSGYRGEIKIILANFGEDPVCIRHGDRIAQGVVCPIYGEENLNLVKVKKLSESLRNTDGFGSTGKI